MTSRLSGTATVVVNGDGTTSVTRASGDQFTYLDRIEVNGAGQRYVQSVSGQTLVVQTATGETGAATAVAWTGEPAVTNAEIATTAAQMRAQIDTYSSLPSGRGVVSADAGDTLIRLDAITSCVCRTWGTLTAPPASPSAGDCHLTGTSCTGAWAGHDDQIAQYIASAAGGAPGWRFITPFYGLDCFDAADGKRYFYTGSAWQAGMGPATLAGYGISDAVTLVTAQTITGEKTIEAQTIINQISDYGSRIFWEKNGISKWSFGFRELSDNNIYLYGDAGTDGTFGVDANIAPYLDDINTLGKAAQRFAYLFLAPHTPASASAPGSPGQIGWDGNYLWVCTAANHWRHAVLVD